MAFRRIGNGGISHDSLHSDNLATAATPTTRRRSIALTGRRRALRDGNPTALPLGAPVECMVGAHRHHSVWKTATVIAVAPRKAPARKRDIDRAKTGAALGLR